MNWLGRLEHYWVYGGLCAGLLILLLTPMLAASWSLAMLLVFLQLPLYMLHQYEEHDDDRFARFINRTLGGGREILPAAVVFLVNVPGVYGLNLVSIWLAATVDVGWGLIGLYLILLNALAHIGQAIAMRTYNPGLGTAIVLFLPASVATLWVLTANGHASLVQHLTGLIVAVLVHAALVAYAVARRRSPDTPASPA